MKDALRDLRKKLRSEKTFIPTHRDFDRDALHAFATEWIDTNRDHLPNEIISLIESTVAFLPTMHLLFLILDSMIEFTVKETKLDTETLVSCLVAQANITYLSTMQLMRASFKGKGDVQATDIFGHKTESLDPYVGRLQTFGALATSVDILHNLFTSINTMEGDAIGSPVSDDFLAIQGINKLTQYCNVRFGIKDTYDEAIWNNGYFKKRGEDRYLISYLNSEDLKLTAVGQFRVQQDCLASYVGLKNMLAGNIVQNKRIKHGLTIVSAALVEGVVSYKLGPGFDPWENDQVIQNHATIYTYYDFLENVSLPDIPGLKILDLVALFELIMSLYTKVGDSVSGNDCRTIDEVLHFSFRIGRTELAEYLLERSNYERSEVEQFISYLINARDGRVNLWNRPFYQIGSTLITPALTICGANMYNLVDYWLEQAGLNLHSRGRQLEAYLQQEIQGLFNKKGYSCRVCERKKFRASNREREEIDLIINLKDIVIIAEVKCVTYPMEVRDYHNAFERLMEGSEQVIRKSAFFERHRSEFEPFTGDTSKKPVVRIVITNYPFFSGRALMGIPIVDVHWLRQFVKHSQLIDYVAYEQDGVLQNEGKVVTTLYRDESEFCAVFEQQMRNPAIIEDLAGKVVLSETKMTLQGFPFEIYRQTAEFLNTADN